MSTTLTLVNAGVDRLANLFLNAGATPNDNYLHLSQNLVAGGDPTTVASDFTEISLTGYTEATLLGSNWTGSTAAGVSTWDYPAITFSFTEGGQTVYDVYILDTAGDLIAYAPLDTPFTVPAGGGDLTITPTWTQKQCP